MTGSLRLFGYYLAAAALAYLSWPADAPENPLIADWSTLAAVGYGLAGGLGAAVLAVVAPMLTHNYSDTTARSGADPGAVRDCVAGRVAFAPNSSSFHHFPNVIQVRPGSVAPHVRRLLRPRAAGGPQESTHLRAVSVENLTGMVGQRHRRWMNELLVGYARVSTEQQDLTVQGNGSHALGVGDDRIYVDRGRTGSNPDRRLRQALACRG